MESEMNRGERDAQYTPKRSVMENAERISPLRRGINHFFCCALFPYFARTSNNYEWAQKRGSPLEMTAPMLPVSGAEQLTASGPIGPARPSNSAMTAYYERDMPGVIATPFVKRMRQTSRLVRDTPYSG
jgi:hypothetical protein